MENVRDLLKSSIELELEELKKAKNVDESKTITDNAVKLTEAYLKTVKGQDDIFNNDVDRQKILAETKKLKLEAERIEEEKNKPEPGFIRRNEETMVKVAGTLVGLFGIVSIQELGNKILQGNWNAFIPKV